MKSDEKTWLDEFAVTCRVFKGRWSIRHCLRMSGDISDLRIRMSSRDRGKVTHHESAYNPCKGCKVMINYLESRSEETPSYDGAGVSPRNEVWTV